MKQRNKELVFEGNYWNKLEISWQKGIIIVLLFEAEHPSVLIESMLRSINVKVIKQKTKQFIKAGHTI